jgi:hypothetical protein
MGRDYTLKEKAGLKLARIWHSQIYASCSHWGLFPLLPNDYGDRNAAH